MSKHPIVHIEIAATDPGKAAEFYSKLFGWRVGIDETVPGVDYMTFAADPGPGGAFPEVDDDLYKVGDVILYVATDDVEATLSKAESLGAKVLVPKTEIPGVGWYAIFADPAGNRMALFTGMGDAAE